MFWIGIYYIFFKKVGMILLKIWIWYFVCVICDDYVCIEVKCNIEDII